MDDTKLIDAGEKKGDKKELLSDETVLNCDGFYINLLNDINQAQETIDIETYIYTDDFFGTTLASALINAVARGVNVRLLVDGFGTPLRSASLEKMENAGVKIRVFHPFPWKFWHLNRANIGVATLLFKMTYNLFKLNTRNHRKTCIIDQAIVYVGSVNITQRHLSKRYQGENWEDTVVRLSSPLIKNDIKDLKLAFDIAWQGFPLEERIKEAIIKKRITSIFRLNYSRRRRRGLYKSLLKRIKNARDRVWVTSAYFNPDYMIMKRLTHAAKSGIDVKIILPYKSDIKLMAIFAATFYTRLLKAGVKVYEYLPSILHSKVIIIDDWFLVGSSNLNQRSLRHDLEVDVNIQSDAAKKVLEQQFALNIANSRLLDIKNIEKLPLYQRILGRLLLFLKYFL